MSNFYKAIVSNYPTYDPKIVEELTFLVKKHNLKWLVFKGEVYFIMRYVCEAKGRELRDACKHWANGKLPGKSTLLKFKELKEFKALYKEVNLEPIKAQNNLYIGNYIYAYYYFKANTSSNTSRMYFIETDIEQLYQSTFGGERQLKLDSGRVDVINEDEVIEIKKDTVDCNSIGQLLRYLNSSNRVKGKLVAPSITSDAINLLKVLNSSGYSLKYITVDVEKESA